MATRLVKELRYDAGAEAVHAMLMDPAFRERVLASQRVLRGSVSVAGERVEIEQVLAADGIPPFARKFVGEEIVIHQREEWRTPTAAEVQVRIPGRPGDIVGTATLAESDGSTVERVDLEIRVSIPLVGGKIEALVGDLLGKALGKEHETGVAWLAGR